MNKGRRILNIILLSANAIAALALLISYSAAYIDPDTTWIPAFFGLAYPVTVLINLAFVLLWLIRWKKYIFISLVCILAGWNNIRSLYPVRIAKPKHMIGDRIRITSYNVHQLSGVDPTYRKGSTTSEVTTFLASQGADILFIQEFCSMKENYQDVLSRFTQAVGLEHYAFMNYSGKLPKNRINAIAIFSRYPIINKGHFKAAGGNLYAIFADILLRNDTIRLYNLHLESIKFGKQDYSFYSNLTERDTDAEDLQLKEGSKRMVWKLRKAFIKRSVQVQSLTRHMSQSPYPVILGGDFNDTPSSYTYARLTKTLRDAFKDAGDGFFESTYAGKLPSFRIDYILYSNSFRALEYERHNVALSDHFPISSTLIYQP